MTRAAPAEILGLHDRGKLTPGAVADVVVYETRDDREQMFRRPRLVMKRGRILRRDSVAVTPAEPPTPDATLAATPSWDAEAIARLRPIHASAASFAMDRLWIGEEEMTQVLGTTIESSGMGRQHPVSKPSSVSPAGSGEAS